MQGSSVVTKIGLVLQKPTLIPNEIGSALTASSNFFINYVAIQVAAARARFRVGHGRINLPYTAARAILNT